VPTVAPPPGWGEDLADGHAAQTITYDVYCGIASQLVAVDPAAAAAAYRTLMTDAALRRKQGAAARARAIELFDWRVVVGRYQEFWAELGERRRAAAESAARKAGAPSHPARADPFRAMAGYATATLAGGDEIELMPGAKAEVFDTLARTPLLNLGRSAALKPEDMHRLIGELAKSERARVADLAASWPAERRIRMQRSLLWLAKMGMVRVHRPGPPKNGGGKS